MIYRLYYRPGSLREDPDEARRYRDILLRYAFFHEKQLIFDDQIIVRNEWGKPAVQSCPQIQYNVSHCKGLVSCIFADAPVGFECRIYPPVFSVCGAACFKRTGDGGFALRAGSGSPFFRLLDAQGKLCESDGNRACNPDEAGGFSGRG